MTNLHTEIFADGIGEITLTGPTVRIDLVSLSPSDRDADGNPLPVFKQRIIMPIESFMNSYDLIHRVANELIEGGAVKRREPQGQPGQGAPERMAARSSPNFA